jgi:hypothetical protein
MNIWKTFLLRFSIYAVLAGFLAIFSYYKFFKPDSENVILIEGKHGSYYVKFVEFNSKSNIQIVINKLLDKPSNRQVLVAEGKYEFNENCDQTINSVEDLMDKIHFYQEEQNRLLSTDIKCYLEKTLQ